MDIVIIGDNPKLEKVLKFWRLKYRVISGLSEPFWRCDLKDSIQGPTIFVSNCLPTLKFWKKVYEEPNSSHMSPITTDIKDGNWHETFCIYLNINTWFGVTPTLFTHDANYITQEYDDPLFNDINVRPNLSVAWDMSSKFWYNVSSSLSKELLLPLWIHEVQLESLKNKSITDYNGILSQAIFSRAYQYKRVKGTIDEAVNHLKSISHLSKEGTIYEVNERFGKHPLTLPGIIMIENDKNLTTPDSNFTIIGHFYNLNIPSKPVTNYLQSLEEYRKLLHPVIFYGDEEICKVFMKLREEVNLGAFTKVVPGKYSDWPVWNEKYQYESITLLKPYIIMDAIEKNPFMSDYYVYMDPGIYKHQCFKTGDFTGIRLFDNFKIDGDKIKMQRIGNPCTTDEELNEESVLCGIMVGTQEAWSRFFPKFDELLSTLGIYHNEQKLFTRLATLYPDYFDLVIGGLDKKYYTDFLGL